MHRFFIKQDNIKRNSIYIEGEDVQHISKVLRLRPDDVITVCDQSGMDYKVRITEISKNNVKTEIMEKYTSIGEPQLEVVLYQGIPKSTKMDLIIQKCTEMGISRIVPISTMRTVVKLETEKDEKKKVERWIKIAEEAAKQSKRGKIPAIGMPVALEEAYKEAATLELCIMPYELEHTVGIKQVLTASKVKSVGIFIGPEGGFDIAEVNQAIAKGVIPVTLGTRILRTETAGFTALTCVMYEYNQLG
ncbi:MAG: 16S rRNA (uracil(1498)-N(3))-methyltransferase [Bacillota bacterium]